MTYGTYVSTSTAPPTTICSTSERPCQRATGSFFFQAEDRIPDGHVTGVQTCALPISCSFGSIPKISSGSSTERPRDSPFVFNISIFIFRLLFNDYKRSIISGNRTFDYDQILFGMHFQYLQILDFNYGIPHLAGHFLPFHNFGRGSGCTDRTGSSLLVFVPMTGRPTTKPVSPHHSLKSFSLGGTHHINDISLFKNLTYRNFIPEFFSSIFEAKITEFRNIFFRRCICFREMSHQWLCGVFLSLLTKSQLKGVVPVCLHRLHLSYYTGTSFDYRASYVLTGIIIKTCHADFSA